MHLPGRVAVASLCLILAACGGDDGAAPDAATPDAEIPEDDPPSVVFAMPLDGAVEVAADAVMTAFFDEAIDVATIDDSSFTVEDQLGGAVAGTVTPLPTGAVFTPAAPLSADRTYLARVSTAVTDLAGNALADDATWSFATHQRTWGAAELVEQDNAGSAEEARVVFDPLGDGIAAWSQDDGTRNNIWASRYVAGSGWATPALVETLNTGDAVSVSLGASQDPSTVELFGAIVFAVWAQSDGTRNNIWASRFWNGWSAPALIETTNLGVAQFPAVAVDTIGNAMAVWQQFDGTRLSIWANRFDIGNGWGTATLVENDDVSALGALSADVAFDPGGDAIAVWHQHDGTRYNIWANEYMYPAGWGTPVLLETTNTGNALAPQITIDDDDHATVVWYQTDGTRYSIWTNRHDGAAWSGATLLEAEDGEAGQPDLSTDLAGNSIAVWSQDDGDGWRRVQARRYVAGTGWEPATRLDQAGDRDTAFPSVALAPDGDAVVAWGQFDGTRYNLWSARYRNGDGWGAPELLEHNSPTLADPPQAAIDLDGDAFVVWTQSDGVRINVHANAYR